jgi:hypothetical protein
MSKPILFFPYHDPDAKYAFALLESLDELKGLFSEVCVGVTTKTAETQKQLLDRLAERGCHLLLYPEASNMGMHQKLGLEFASRTNDQASIFFGYIDRILYALKTQHREAFVRDISKDYESDLVIFSRSQSAWDTHPKAYRDIECAIIDIGEAYIGKRMDWTWCGAIFKNECAKKIYPLAKADDFSIIGEFILINRKLGGSLDNQFVDWLEWEDPFWDNKKTIDQPASKQELDFRLTYSLNVAKLFLEM